MFDDFCNEIKYLIIKYAIFADTNEILRLRKVNSYFRFAVDEEVFSVISNVVETFPIFGRNYFSNFKVKVGYISWCPRTNNYDLTIMRNTDLYECKFVTINKNHNSLLCFLANDNSALNRNQFNNLIMDTFNPLNIFEKRLQFSHFKWQNLHYKYHEEFIRCFLICDFCRSKFKQHYDDSNDLKFFKLKERDYLLYMICPESAMKFQYEKNIKKIQKRMPQIIANSNKFYELLKPQMWQIIPYHKRLNLFESLLLRKKYESMR